MLNGRIFKWASCCGLLAVATLVVASNLDAQPDGGVPGDNPCVEDAMRFCSDVEPGEGRIMRCLKERASSLDSRCEEFLDKMGGIATEFQAACGDDVNRFCQGIAPGGGRIGACLKDNLAEITAECKSLLVRYGRGKNRR